MNETISKCKNYLLPTFLNRLPDYSMLTESKLEELVENFIKEYSLSKDEIACLFSMVSLSL
jgi:hypothetical protein